MAPTEHQERLWDTPDLGPFEHEHTDRQKITEGRAVPCRICEIAFRRLRLTQRYCAACERGFCDGEHGNFSDRGRGRCVRCGPQP